MHPPAVLLLDDGELEDLARLLGELGVRFERRRGATAEEPFREPRLLLAASARRAIQLKDRHNRTPSGSPSQAVRIAVVDEDSPALRRMLRSLDFDLLVRRPVHPEALRLLVLRALYQGPERRRAARIPIGCMVSVKVGGERSWGTLAEVSHGGCRVLIGRPLADGTRLKVKVPAQVADGAILSLPGQVVRCAPASEGGTEPMYSLGVLFQTLAPETRARLQALLEARAEGPVALVPGTGFARGAEALEDDVLAERRKATRHAFRDRVIALGNDARRVLMGRDLSTGGMRVARHPDLGPGDEFPLAVFAAPGESPFTVRARVLRDDGDLGLALRFLDVSPDAALQLEAFVAGLPAVESLVDPEGEALGAVVAEIVESVDHSRRSRAS